MIDDSDCHCRMVSDCVDSKNIARAWQRMRVRTAISNGTETSFSGESDCIPLDGQE